MSRRINTTHSGLANVELAEAALLYYAKVVFSPDSEVNHYQSPMYKAAQKNLLTAIKFAWPHMDAKRIYELWVDCNESLSYCVRYIRENNRYPF